MSDIDLSRFIRAGDTVTWGEGTAEPLPLTRQLVRSRADLGPVRVFVLATLSDTLQPEHADAFTFAGLGPAGTNRHLARAVGFDTYPIHLSALPKFIADGTIAIDVVLVQVSPADAYGRHSLGVVSDYLQTAIENARAVVAEINQQMPFTLGDTTIDGSLFSGAIETDRPVLELPTPQPGTTEHRIGGYAATLIPDGATIQVGIGSLPAAALAALREKEDIGVHSGIVGDGILDLIEARVVTNRRKSIDPHVTIASALFGTQRLYDYAHRNPAIMLRSVDYTHNLDTLAQIDDFVSINTAVEIDLTGQVNAETVPGHSVGAVGGQVDFIRGSARSRRGRSLILLPSTARSGRVSRIVSRLNEGVVTTARSDIDTVITEWGIAELRGRSNRERARLLAGVAHPDYRDELLSGSRPPL